MIKYVFVDDANEIIVNKVYKDRVKFVTKKGKQVVIHQVNVRYVNKKDDTWLLKDEIVKEFDFKMDDVDDDDGDVDDDNGSIYLKELDLRNEDLLLFKSIVNNDNDTIATFDDFIDGVSERYIISAPI